MKTLRFAAAAAAAFFLLAGTLAAEEPKYHDGLWSVTLRVEIKKDSLFGYGSGEIIGYHNGDAIVLTAGHLFAESERVDVGFNSEWHSGRVLKKTDTSGDNWKPDLALVAVKDESGTMRAVPLSEKKPIVGDEIEIIASPSGDGNLKRRQRAAVRYIDHQILFADKPTKDGESGGAVLNGSGELVGVLSGSTDHEATATIIPHIRTLLMETIKTDFSLSPVVVRETGNKRPKRRRLYLFQDARGFCLPCVAFGKDILRKDFADRIKMFFDLVPVDVSTDEGATFAKSYGFDGRTPTFVVEGEKTRIVGYSGKDWLLYHLRPFMVCEDVPPTSKPEPKPAEPASPFQEAPAPPAEEPAPRPKEESSSSVPPGKLDDLRREMLDIKATLEARIEAIATIKREQSVAGDKGPTGDKGPSGDKGATGDKGPTGDKGSPGQGADNKTIEKLVKDIDDLGKRLAKAEETLATFKGVVRVYVDPMKQ